MASSSRRVVLSSDDYDDDDYQVEDRASQPAQKESTEKGDEEEADSPSPRPRKRAKRSKKGTGRPTPDKKVEFRQAVAMLTEDYLFHSNVVPAVEVLRSKRNEPDLTADQDPIITRKPLGWTDVREQQARERYEVEKPSWALTTSIQYWISFYQDCYDYFCCSPLDIFRNEQKVNKGGERNLPQLTQTDLMCLCRITTHDAWRSPRRCDELVLALQYPTILRTRDHRPWSFIHRHAGRYLFLGEMSQVLQQTPMPARELRKVACDQLKERGLPDVPLRDIFEAIERVVEEDEKIQPLTGGEAPDIYDVSTEDILNVETALNNLAQDKIGLIPRLPLEVTTLFVKASKTVHHRIKSNRSGNIHDYHMNTVLTVIRERIQASEQPSEQDVIAQGAPIQQQPELKALPQYQTAPQISPGLAAEEDDGFVPVWVKNEDEGSGQHQPISQEQQPVHDATQLEPITGDHSTAKETLPLQ